MGEWNGMEWNGSGLHTAHITSVSWRFSVLRG